MSNYIRAIGTVQGSQLIVTTSNTSPLILYSTQLVNNLNSQFLNSKAASYYTNYNNLSNVFINVQNGGTGLSNISNGYVPFGSNQQQLNTSSNFFYNQNNQSLQLNQLKITTASQTPLTVNSSNMVSNLNVQYLNNQTGYFYSQYSNISNVLVNVQQGGTGLTNICNGYVIFGSTQNQCATSSNFFWDQINNRLGILNSQPQYTLDIDGDVNITGNLYVSNTNVNTNTKSGGGTISNVTQGYILFGNGSNSVSGQSNLFWDSTNFKLGLNNTNPNYVVDVNGDIYASSNLISCNQLISFVQSNIPPIQVVSTSLVSNLNVQYLGGQNSNFYTQYSNISNVFVNVSNGGTGLSNISNGLILFGSNYQQLSTTSNLFWDNTKNRLGINNTQPQQTLDVSGSAVISGDLQLLGNLIVGTGSSQNQDSGANALSISVGGTGVSYIQLGCIMIGNGANSIITTSNFYWDNIKFNLGIRNSNPNYALDVNGDIHTYSNLITQNQFISSVSQGTAPFNIISTTLVSNLNVQYLNGQLGSYYTNVNNVSYGILPTNYGGTGISNFIQGYIHFGNNNIIGQTSNLFWDSINQRLGILNTTPSYALDVVGNIQASTNIIASNSFISLVVSGTSPLSVKSTTMVSNLNVQYLNGQQGSFYTNANNISQGILQTSMGGTGLSNPLQGQILFGQLSGSIGQSSNLIWNSSNSFLGINNSNPQNALDIIGNVNIQGSVTITNNLIMSNSHSINQGQIIFGGQSNQITQSSNLCYDSTLNYLGLGTSTPQVPFHVTESTNITATYSFFNVQNNNFNSGYVSNYTGPVSIQASAKIVGQEFNAVSDQRKKHDIKDLCLDYEINFIKKLRPILYKWKNQKQQEYGFIAQDVFKLKHQELVGFVPDENIQQYIDEDNFSSPNKLVMTLNYEKFIPIHTKILQHLLISQEELFKQNSLLQNQIKQLKRQ